MRRRNKYNAKPIVIDGIRFASQAEGRHYASLRLLEKAGHISDLELQPKFDCVVNGEKVCRYTADFRFFDKQQGRLRVQDVKGVKTPVYKLKAKLVRALYGVEIEEIK